MTEVKAYLYAIRHGETDYNRARRIQGATDIPLNEIGIKQAEYAATELSKEHFDVIVSSNLQRAIRTADIICEAQTQKPRPVRIIKEELHELSFGDFDGHYLDDDSEVAREFKRIWTLWGEGSMTDACPNGETPGQVRDRACPTILKILEDTCSKETTHIPKVVVVSHGRCLKITLSTFLSVPPKDIDLANVSISKLEWYGGNKFKAVYINKTDHIKCEKLPPVCPFLKN